MNFKTFMEKYGRILAYFLIALSFFLVGTCFSNRPDKPTREKELLQDQIDSLKQVANVAIQAARAERLASEKREAELQAELRRQEADRQAERAKYQAKLAKVQELQTRPASEVQEAMITHYEQSPRTRMNAHARIVDSTYVQLPKRIGVFYLSRAIEADAAESEVASLSGKLRTTDQLVAELRTQGESSQQELTAAGQLLQAEKFETEKAQLDAQYWKDRFKHARGQRNKVVVISVLGAAAAYLLTR
jgi:hypothetical protein